tara:strand:+ start:992 stop:1462 length:471 start_codon:yes stop_codon:yes gene_type:complete
MFCIALKDAEEIEKIMFKINTSNILILMGSIPFIFFMALSFFSLDNFFNYSINYLASIYSIIIISFISGTHWGIFLNNKIPINLFASSNIVTITVYFSFLTLDNFYFTLISIISFISLLLFDFYIYKQAITLIDYFVIRFLVSMIVIFSLLILLFI